MIKNDCNKLKFCWVCQGRRECLYFSCEWIKSFTSIILSFKEQNHNRDVHKRQFSFWYVCRVVVLAYFVSWICQSHNSYLLGIHPISGLCVLIGQSKTLLYDLLGDPPYQWFVYICFSISGFYFWIRWNIIEHPPRYSWNIIEHPPRYSWNIIEHPPRYS